MCGECDYWYWVDFLFGFLVVDCFGGLVVVYVGYLYVYED